MADPKTTLRVQIVADLADIKQGLGLLRGELASVKAAAASGNQGMGLLGKAAGDFKGILAGLGITVGAIGMANLAKDALNVADNIGKLSQKTGASVGFLSVLRTAVHGAEDDMGALERSLILLAKRQDDAASGNKDAIATFKRLGLSVQEVKQSNPEELFKRLVEKFGDMKSGAEKAALAQAVFGKSGADLIPILNELANGGLGEAEKRSKALGTYLTEDMVAAASAGKDALDDLGLVAEGMANTFGGKVAPIVTRAMADMAGSVEVDGRSMVDYLAQAVAGVIQTIVSLFTVAKNTISTSIDLGRSSLVTLWEARQQLFSKGWDAMTARLARGVEQNKAIVGQWADGVTTHFDRVVNAFSGNTPLPKSATPERATGTGGDPDAGNATKAIRGVVDANEVAGKAIQRQLKQLEDDYAHHLVSIAEFFARKRALQEQAIDLEIAQAEAQARAATTSDEQSRALTRIVELQAERAAIGPDLAREQAEAEADLADKLQDVKNQLDDLGGRGDAALLERLTRQFAELRKEAALNGNEAGVAWIDSFIKASVSRQKLEGIESAMQDLVSRLQVAEGSISAQAEAGLLPQSTAEERLQAIREHTLRQLEEMRRKLLEYLASHDGPEVAAAEEALARLDGEIAQVNASLHQFRGEVQDNAEQSLQGFFDKIATGGVRSFKDLKAAFLDFVLSFIQGLGRMASEWLAKRAIMAIFDILWPGAPAASGSSGGLASRFSGFTNHTGGMAGTGAPRSFSWNPMHAIRRMHEGGLAGFLGADEVMSVLQKGEEVVTRRDPRHRYNLGRDSGKRQPPDKYILAFGDEQLANALAGAAGERVHVLHARNNPGI